MADDTTALSYWLNWRFFLCALWIIIAMIAAAILIIKYEVLNKKTSHRKDDDDDVEPVGILYEDETWRTSLKAIHPAWLLIYRLIAFGVMLAILIASLIINKADIFFFYTQLLLLSPFMGVTVIGMKLVMIISIMLQQTQNEALTWLPLQQRA